MTAYIGIALFGFIKYMGYFMFLNLVESKGKVSKAYLMAFIRLVAGVVVGMTILSLTVTGRDGIGIYFTGILAGRVAIWSLIFFLAYKNMSLKKKLIMIALGTAISYALDVPAGFVGFMTVGGVC